MVRVNIKRLCIFISMLSLLLGSLNSSAATITVNVDRRDPGLNESFVMTFESDSSVDDEPDFTPLNKDFQILSRSSNNSMSIVNGKISSSKKWQLTVLARRAGKLIIPPIRFGSDQSQPSFVNVASGHQPSASAKANNDIFIEVEAGPRKPYVQAEVIYTVRLFLAVPVANASLSEPGISGANAVIERLGEDRNYQTSRGGRRFNVVERRYAIYPQMSGSMRIEAVMFQGQKSRRSTFSLFNDPFGPQPQTIVERSEAIDLDVQPVPGQFPAGHWLPAKSLTLTESWSQDPPQFKVGEPLTRTLTLTAEGQTASQLLELPDWVPDAFKQYPDQPSLQDNKSDSGIRASRVEKVAIIPNQAGEYVLPEISLPWWNTSSNKLEYVRLAERKISVSGLAPVLQTPAQSGSAPVLSASPAYENTTVIAATAPQTALATSKVWQIVSATLLLLWLTTLLLWWRSRIARQPSVTKDKRLVELKQAVRNIEQACLANDADKLKQALLLWARLQWPDSIASNLGEIGRRSPSALAEKLLELNDHLYSQRQQSWDGKAFWQVFRESRQTKNTLKQKPEGELEPLYRL